MKCGCLIYFFLNSANLICRGTDISKYFRESLGLRDNESQLHFSLGVGLSWHGIVLCFAFIYKNYVVEHFDLVMFISVLLLPHLSRRLKVSYCDHSPPSSSVCLSVRPSTIFKQHLLNHYFLYRKNFKKSFYQKPLDRFQYNLAETFPWWPSTKNVQAVMIRQKTWPLGGGAYFPYFISIKNFKNLLVINQRTDFTKLGRTVSSVPLDQDCSSRYDSSKNMAARGWDLFSPIYVYIKF